MVGEFAESGQEGGGDLAFNEVARQAARWEYGGGHKLAVEQKTGDYWMKKGPRQEAVQKD